MPVKIPDALPATKTLADENIFVMTEKRSATQDIRPLRIAILNLMPTKEKTETQLLRLISNSPLQVEITLLRTDSYESKNVSADYLNTFYRTFSDVRDEVFDGVIITGAPVEKLDFHDVAYWNELTRDHALGRRARVFHAVHLLGGAGGAVLPLRHRKASAGTKSSLACLKPRLPTCTTSSSAGWTTPSPCP